MREKVQPGLQNWSRENIRKRYEQTCGQMVGVTKEPVDAVYKVAEPTAEDDSNPSVPIGKLFLRSFHILRILVFP